MPLVLHACNLPATKYVNTPCAFLTDKTSKHIAYDLKQTTLNSLSLQMPSCWSYHFHIEPKSIFDATGVLGFDRGRRFGFKTAPTGIFDLKPRGPAFFLAKTAVHFSNGAVLRSENARRSAVSG